MRSKFKWIFTFLIAAMMQLSFAQEKTITGVVSDASGVLPGANIIVKGTKRGAQTDASGKYSIQASKGEVLVFTFIGTQDATATVGNASTINMVLKAEGVELTEVVVTSQGIKKEKKALGYAVTTIKAEDLASKPSTDVARALTGKAAGVNIQQTSGLSGSGTNIIIRGYSSITGSNQPLFVVDGVPFNTDTNTDGNFLEGSTNASSRFLDLDPNSIASVSVLKGLAATTLYGQAGRSGVVLVTTKSGDTKSINKKMEVTYSHSLYMTQIASLPQYQNSYGNGFNNDFRPAYSNWGPSFDTRDSNGVDKDGNVKHPYDYLGLNSVFPEFKDVKVAYQPYNNVAPFFGTGQVITNSINVGGRSEKTTYNMSVGNTNDEGFIENNRYQRLNFSIGGQTKLSNKLTFIASMNYVRTNKVAPPTGASFGSGGAGGTTSVFAHILYTPRSLDLFNLPYSNPLTGGSVYYRSDIANPLWTLKNSADKEGVRRFFGNFKAVFEINDWSNLTYGLSLDNYTQKKVYFVNKGGPDVIGGLLQTSNRESTIFDHTLSYNFNKPLGEKWSIDGVLGFNPRQESLDYNILVSGNQFLYGINVHDNFSIARGYSGNSNYNIIGLYGSTTVGYNKYLYLNLQGRRDSFSSLTKENRSLFYPSVSLSFVPTDAFSSLKSNGYLNYLKLRISSGSSAGFPDPYQTQVGLSQNANGFDDGTQPIQVISPNQLLGNVNLKPELVKELEFGIESKFFKNRVGLDISLYDKRSTQNIIDRPLAPETGSLQRGDNIAEVSNKGIELGMNFQIIKPTDKSFGWEFSGNFTKNKNIIENLGTIDKVYIAGFSFLGNFAIEGQPYGVILGSSILRDGNGNYVVGGDGNYVPVNDPTIIGDPNAKWRSTMINEFSYKGVSFGVQFEFQKGGDIYSTTAAALLSRGLTEDTNFDRNQTFVLPGVNQNGNVNTTQIDATSYGFQNSGFFIREQAIYDATNLRMREISLSYKLPKKFLEKTPFGSIAVSIVGQNLWFKAFNFPKYLNFDPEVMSLGVGNGQGFDYLTGPTAKRFGFNLNLTF